ncbi:Dabb family protein [Flavihumibacter fluvii]|uniref:Dabb family protein n=1 Tax=Flavihumibacter fluvii TaxID=2838157 RepID=UPI001BDEF325|nr:Dabb family protein [Flavihumibacter fluvii]ULQ51425.1 Dabb family protein [Flavihumibacter fluvii]
MKYLIAVCFAMVSIVSMTNAQDNKETGKVLRHVVLFKFKENSPASEIKRVEAAFRALPSQISEIKSFEWGLNNSPENLNQGFTHCFFLTFNSAKDRDTYLPHPAHKEFGKQLGDLLEKVLVIDYWAEK